MKKQEIAGPCAGGDKCRKEPIRITVTPSTSAGTVQPLLPAPERGWYYMGAWIVPPEKP